MVTVKNELLTIVVILLVAAGCLTILSLPNNPFRKYVSSVAAPFFSTPTPTPPLFVPTPSPTPTPDLDKPLVTSKTLSPDGKKVLIENKQQKKDADYYAFLTVDSDRETNTTVYAKAVNRDDEIEIPFNTFSPDNEFFFLKENTATTSAYIVFHTNAKEFSNGERFANISELFAAKLPSFTLENVTGWADPTLLIVNAVSVDTTRKASFWFDTSSLSFIPLSTYFY